MFETSVDVYDHDLELFKSNTATQGDVQEHLSYMLSDAKRKAEVSLKNLTTEERTLFEEAKNKEVDQWISNAVLRSSGEQVFLLLASWRCDGY